MSQSSIEKKMRERFGDQYSQVNNNTQFDTDKTMFERLGSNIFDFTTEAVKGGVNMALFGVPERGLPRLGVDPFYEAKRETEVQKWGGDIGSALGFLAPFGVGKIGISAVGRAAAGKASGTKIVKEIQKEADGLVTKLIDDGSIKVGKGTMPTTANLADDLTPKGFIDEIITPKIKTQIEGFDDVLHNAKLRNEFLDSIKDQSGKLFKEFAESSGISITDDAAKQIGNLVKKSIDDVGGRPVSNLQGYFAKTFGLDDKPGRLALTHMAEEGILFAGVDNVIAALDAGQEGVEYDPMNTTLHALAVGGALGAVRFIPGGIEGGASGLSAFMRMKNPFERIGALFRGTYANNYNVASASGQNSIGQIFSYLALSSSRVGGKQGKAAPIYMENYITKDLQGLLKQLTRTEDDKVVSVSASKLLEYLQSGTPEQKKIAAQIMQRSISKVHSKMTNGEWAGEFARQVRKDLVGSSPRMFLGGLVMGGGPSMLMDENLTVQDKMRSMLIGGFLSKHGKGLVYKDFNTGAFRTYEGALTFNRKPQNRFSKEFEQVDNWVQALGSDMSGPRMTYWKKVGEMVHKQNKLKHDFVPTDSNPEVFDAINEVINTERGEGKQKNRIFIKNKNQNIEVDSKPIENDAKNRQLYDDAMVFLSKDQYIGENKSIKEWGELTANQKRTFVELMKKKGIEANTKGFDKMNEMFNQKNNQTIDDIVTSFIATAENMINSIESDLARTTGPVIESNSETGVKTFRKIDIRTSANRIASMPNGDVILNKINEYNHLVDKITEVTMHQKANEAPIRITEANMPRSFDEFISNAVSGQRKLNEILKVEDQHGYRVQSPEINQLLDFNSTYREASKARKNIGEVITNSPILSALLRVNKNGQDLGLPEKITIKGDNVPRSLQEKINYALQLARAAESGSPVLSSNYKPVADKRITQAEAKDILNEFSKPGNDIRLFDNVTKWAGEGRLVINDVQRKILFDRISESTVIDPKTGEPVKITDVHINQYIKLVEKGFIIPGTTTMRGFIASGMDTIKKIEAFKEANNISKDATLSIEQAKELLKNAESNGLNEVQVEVLKELIESKQRKDIDIEQVFKELEEVMRPLIKTDKGGFVVVSSNEKAVITEADAVQLLQTMNDIKLGKEQNFVTEIMDTISRDLMQFDISVQRGAFTEKQILDKQQELKTKKYLYAAIKEASRRGDALDLVSLATELKIYDFYKKDFKEYNNNTWLELRTRLKKMLETTKFQEIDTEINSLYRQLLREEGLTINDYNISDIQQILVNNVFKKFSAKENGIDLSNSQYVNKLFLDEVTQGGYNGNITNFTKDFMKDLTENNPNLSKRDLESIELTTMTFLLNSKSNYNTKRIVMNANNTQNATFSNEIIKKSIVIERLNEIADNADIPIHILDSQGVGFGGFYKGINDTSFLNTAQRLLYTGEYTASHNMYRYMNMNPTEVPTNQKYLTYQYGDNKYLYLIPKDTSVGNRIANKYAEYIESVINDKLVSAEKQDLLDKVNVKPKTQKDGTISYEWKTLKQDSLSNNYKTATKELDVMLNDMIVGELFGKKEWWGNQRNGSGKTSAGLVKRLKLFDNISAKRFTKEDINDVVNFLDEPSIRLQDKVVRNELKDFADGKWRQLIIADEVLAGGYEGKLVDEIHSVVKQQIEAYDRAIEAIREVNPNSPDIVKLQELKAKEQAELRNDAVSDASDVNGVTFMPENKMKALALLLGKTNLGDVSGVKPIILRQGSNYFINKTAIMKNAEIQKIFDANPGVASITFTSASKKIGESYAIKTIESKDLWSEPPVTDAQGKETTPAKAKELDISQTNALNPEHMQLISIKEHKNKAAIGLNHTVNLSPDAVGEFYNYVIKERVARVRNNAEIFTDPMREAEAIAQYKLWQRQKVYEEGTTELNNETLGLDALLAEANVNPGLLPTRLDAVFKTFEIDPLFKTKVEGGSSVLAPDINAFGKAELKNTIILDGKIWQAGEISVPESVRNTGVESLDLVTLVKQNKGEADTIVRADTVVKDRFGKIKNLGELFDKLEANHPEYKILIIGERQPHVKHSSIMPVALKNFNADNVAKLNAVDLKRAAEGDFDIDTINYFHNMKHDVMKEYWNNRGVISDSRNVETTNSEMSFANLKYTDYDTRMDYIHNKLRQSDLAKGIVMQSQRLLQWLINNYANSPTQYRIARNSTMKEDGTVANLGKIDTVKGFIMKIPGDRFLVIKQDLDMKAVYQKIADYNQHVLDAYNGYNHGLFQSRKAIYEDLFLGKDGIFEVYGVDKIAYKTTTEGKQSTEIDLKTSILSKREGQEGVAALTGKEKDVIYEHLFTPYSDLLRLSNFQYDRGRQKSVSLQDMITGLETYNSSMRTLEFNIAKDLGVQQKDISLFGFGDNAIIRANKNATDFSGSVMTYDRLLSEIMHIRNITQKINNRDLYSRPSEEYNKTLDEFMISKDLTEALENQIDYSRNKHEYANALYTRIRKMKRLKDTLQSPTSRNRLNKNILYLENLLQKIKKQIPVSESILKQIESDLVVDKLRDYIRKNGKQASEEQLKKIKAEAKKDMENKKYTIEPYADRDLIHSLAMLEGFGRYSQLKQFDLGIGKQEYSELNKNAQDVRRDFQQAWFSLRNNEKVQFKDMKEPIEFTDAAEIYEYFTNRMIGEMSVLGDLSLNNVYLAKVMTPRIEPYKLITFKGKVFPKPETKRQEKFVTLGLRVNNRMFKDSPEMQKLFIKELGKHYSNANQLLRTGEQARNNNADFIPGDTGYVDIFSPAMGHQKSKLVQIFNPEYAGVSRLSTYELLVKHFKYGTVQELLPKLRDTSPDGVVGGLYDVTGLGDFRRMSINGIKDFENSLDLQNRLYVRRDGVNHIVDYRKPFEPIGNVGGSGSSRRKYDVTDEASNMIKKNKRYCP